MKKLIKENLFFFIPFLIFLICSFFLILVFSKTDLHIWSNRVNNNFLDSFFKYATLLGDGVMIAVLFVALLFVKFRYAFSFLTGSLMSSLVVNLFKKVLFDDMFRPSKFFELYETYQLHFVEGVKLHSLNSFPSGHTATAFNLFLMLALIVKSKTLKLIFFTMALLVAYSRVYLSQHFLVDITAGSIIGAIFMLYSYLWFNKINNKWLDKSVRVRTKR